MWIYELQRVGRSLATRAGGSAHSQVASAASRQHRGSIGSTSRYTYRITNSADRVPSRIALRSSVGDMDTTAAAAAAWSAGRLHREAAAASLPATSWRLAAMRARQRWCVRRRCHHRSAAAPATTATTAAPRDEESGALLSTLPMEPWRTTRVRCCWRSGAREREVLSLLLSLASRPICRCRQVLGRHHDSPALPIETPHRSVILPSFNKRSLSILSLSLSQLTQ